MTSWYLYDTGYTERFMGIPEENKEAYENGSVLNLVRHFPDEYDDLVYVLDTILFYVFQAICCFLEFFCYVLFSSSKVCP